MTTPDPMMPQPARVAAVERETHDTFTVNVTPAEGDSFPDFLPGQFSMLYVFGVAEVPISISGRRPENGALTFTIRSVGPGTDRVVSLSPGEWIGVRGPFGRGWPVEEARGKDVVVVAGGIGLAPLRPAFDYFLQHRQDYGRLSLLYGARSPRDLIFRKLLRRWSKKPDTEVLTTVDQGDLRWKGNVGAVTRLFSRIRIDPARTAVLSCGPEVMMRVVARELLQRGIEPGGIYLSMERNMKCAIGFCGHCQFGPVFLCKDGPVFPYSELDPWIHEHEI